MYGRGHIPFCARHVTPPHPSQDAGKNVSDEAQAVRVDNGVLRRQLDALEKLALEAKGDIASLRAERDGLASSLAAAQKEARATQRALADAESEAGERIGQLAGQNAALLKEVADMRSRVAPALAEAEAARGALGKLGEDVDEARKGRADALAKLERAGAAIAAQEAALAEARAQELRLVRALEEEHARGAALTAAALQVRAFGDGEGGVGSAVRQPATRGCMPPSSSQDAALIHARDAEAAAAAQRTADLGAELSRAHEEIGALQAACAAATADAEKTARARAADAAHYDALLHDAHSDIKRIADEARGREVAHAAALSKKAEEARPGRAGEPCSVPRLSDRLFPPIPCRLCCCCRSWPCGVRQRRRRRASRCGSVHAAFSRHNAPPPPPTPSSLRFPPTGRH